MTRGIRAARERASATRTCGVLPSDERHASDSSATAPLCSNGLLRFLPTLTKRIARGRAGVAGVQHTPPLPFLACCALAPERSCRRPELSSWGLAAEAERPLAPTRTAQADGRPAYPAVVWGRFEEARRLRPERKPPTRSEAAEPLSAECPQMRLGPAQSTGDTYRRNEDERRLRRTPADLPRRLHVGVAADPAATLA